MKFELAGAYPFPKKVNRAVSDEVNQWEYWISFFGLSAPHCLINSFITIRRIYERHP